MDDKKQYLTSFSRGDYPLGYVHHLDMTFLLILNDISDIKLEFVRILACT
jgi:hypothetical protein